MHRPEFFPVFQSGCGDAVREAWWCDASKQEDYFQRLARRRFMNAGFAGVGLAEGRRRSGGVPSSWGTLLCLRPVLRPRRDRRCAGLSGRRHGPTRIGNDEGSPREVISGLNHTASALAVYASPGGSPHRTQDSLLAAGQALPGGIRTRRVPTKGFRNVSYITSPSPKLLGADDVPFSSLRYPLFRPLSRPPRGGDCQHAGRVEQGPGGRVLPQRAVR